MAPADVLSGPHLVLAHTCGDDGAITEGLEGSVSPLERLSMVITHAGGLRRTPQLHRVQMKQINHFLPLQP